MLDSRLHPQGVHHKGRQIRFQSKTGRSLHRRGCKGLKPQQLTQRGNDGLFGACFKKYLSVLFAVLLALASTQACAKRYAHNDSTIQDIAVAELPSEARDTLRLIKQGGPFPFPRDGVVFGNYEHRLPRQSRGYYHEYTVKTPGARNRGARRIVCGHLPECYYSGDHYRTFKQIRE